MFSSSIHQELVVYRIIATVSGVLAMLSSLFTEPGLQAYPIAFFDNRSRDAERVVVREAHQYGTGSSRDTRLQS